MSYETKRHVIMKIFGQYVIEELWNDKKPRTPTATEREWLDKGMVPGSLL